VEVYFEARKSIKKSERKIKESLALKIFKFLFNEQNTLKIEIKKPKSDIS